MARTRKTKARQAEILREYGPYPGIEQVHGVTFDGAHVWFARGESIVALDPGGGALVRELAVTAEGGTPSTANTSGSSPPAGSRRSIRSRATSSPPSRRRPTAATRA